MVVGVTHPPDKVASRLELLILRAESLQLEPEQRARLLREVADRGPCAAPGERKRGRHGVLEKRREVASRRRPGEPPGCASHRAEDIAHGLFELLLA